MSREKKWHTTKEIIIKSIALRFSKGNYHLFEKSVWLSSEAAAQLADELEAAYSNYDIAKSEFIQRDKDHHKAHQEYVFDLIRRAKKVVWILRGARA